MKRGSGAKFRTGRSLGLTLWFAFTLFALVIILLFLAVQSLLVGIQYRDRTLSSMREAARRVSEELAGANADTMLFCRIRAIEDECDVRIRLLSFDGSTVDSDGYGEEKFPEIVETLKRDLAEGKEETVIDGDETLGYVTLIDGHPYYLYITSSVARIRVLENSLRWLSLAAALLSVVLAFIASGFVAMLITRPLTEVTARAKELARGHFDLDFKRNYYCLEIQELSDALEYARVEISKADAVQRELIANVSHDFKTPLTMIKAYASMIKEISGEDKKKRDAHTKIIIDEADRLALLVSDVLDLSKLRAGVGTHASAVFNLSELLYAILEKFDYLAETQGYLFEQDIDEERYVFADRERIGRVIYNLLTNAVNYTGADKKVTVRLKAEGTGTRFDVIDTGVGIPKEQADLIWDRYYRLQETHKLPVKGTGLGLSIVRRVLEAEGCPFGVNSEEGKGSDFWVKFPPPPDDTEKERAAAEKAEKEETA